MTQKQIVLAAVVLLAAMGAAKAAGGAEDPGANIAYGEVPDEVFQEVCGGDCLSPQQMHEGCTGEERPDPRGSNYPTQKYCCKHDASGHHVCEWYSWQCQWTKVGDTFYYVCYYKATGEGRRTFCVNSP